MGRVASLDRDSIPALHSFRVGSKVALLIPGRGNVPAVVNYSSGDSAQADDTWFIGGEIGEGEGSYWLSQNETGSVGGHILPSGSEVAWVVEEDPVGGGVVMREVAMEGLLCRPHATASSSSGATYGLGGGPTVPQPVVSSRPDAPAVIFLDFEGGTIHQPMWNLGNPIHTVAPSFTEETMLEIWAIVRDDFRPFNVDVTTDRQRYLSAAPGQRMRCMITAGSIFKGNDMDSLAGIAFIGSFRGAGGFSALREVFLEKAAIDLNKGVAVDLTVPQPADIPVTPFPSDTVCWVFASSVVDPALNNAKNWYRVGGTISHEVGHTLGLVHDGTVLAGNTYYRGHGNGNDGWVPIMGNPAVHAFSQWSRGEYAGAFNFPIGLQNDIAVIASNVAVPPSNGFAPDDHGDTPATATVLPTALGAFNRRAEIGANDDIDVFAVTTSATGDLLAQVVFEHAGNLDARVELLDSAGTLLVENEERLSRTALLVASNLPAATYYLRVRGNAQGDPAGFFTDPGWSNYGNQGEYILDGFFSGFSGGGAPPPTIAGTGQTRALLSIGAVPEPTVAEGPPATAIVGLPFAYPLSASPAPDSWSVIEGALPPGLLLVDGSVAGTPTTPGRYEAVIHAAKNGVGRSRRFTFSVVSSMLVPEAVEAVDLAWSFGSSPPGSPWTGQPLVTADGFDAARSGVIGTNASSWMEIEVAGPAVVESRVRVSAGPGDALDVLLDGSVLHTRSGVTDWETVAVTVPSGTHRMRWSYRKDGGGTAGDDAAYVDQVAYLRAPSIRNSDYVTGQVGEPFLLELFAEQRVDLWSSGSGSLPPGLHFDAVGARISGTPTEAGEFALTIFAGNPGGVDELEFEFFIAPAITLGDALDAPELSWYTGGANPWMPVTSPTEDGIDALRSGPIRHRRETVLMTSVTGPGTLSFSMKVESEAEFDKATFHIDQVRQITVSGMNGWVRRTYEIGPGEHDLLWGYAKDGSGNAGGDAVWLDRVVWTGQSPPPPGPVPRFVSPSAILAHVGSPLSIPVLFEGAPDHFSASSLPPGLSIHPQTGVISGTPAGSAVVTKTTITADNAHGSGSGEISIRIEAPAGLPQMTGPGALLGVEGRPFHAKLRGTNGATGWEPFAYSFRSGDLPAGLSLDPVTGEITGTPTEAPFSAVIGWRFENPVGSALGESRLLILEAGQRSYEEWATFHRLGDGPDSINNLPDFRHLDSDGDGYSNDEEYVADTDPRDPESHLGLFRVETGSFDYAVSLSWMARPGVAYVAESSMDLLQWSPLIPLNAEGVFLPVTIEAGSDLETREFYHPHRAAGKPEGFFRVRAIRSAP